jgi:hypothetical protein
MSWADSQCGALIAERPRQILKSALVSSEVWTLRIHVKMCGVVEISVLAAHIGARARIKVGPPRMNNDIAAAGHVVIRRNDAELSFDVSRPHGLPSERVMTSTSPPAARSLVGIWEQ